MLQQWTLNTVHLHLLPWRDDVSKQGALPISNLEGQIWDDKTVISLFTTPRLSVSGCAEAWATYGYCYGYYRPVCMSVLLGWDISMNRRVPVGWRRPRGRLRTSWMSQVKKDTGVPILSNIYIQVTWGGSSIVEIGRYGHYRICDIGLWPVTLQRRPMWVFGDAR